MTSANKMLSLKEDLTRPGRCRELSVDFSPLRLPFSSLVALLNRQLQTISPAMAVANGKVLHLQEGEESVEIRQHRTA
jgi:hypothetical protein